MPHRPGEHRPFDVDALRADLAARMRRLEREEAQRRREPPRERPRPAAPLRLRDELDSYLPPR